MLWYEGGEGTRAGYASARRARLTRADQRHSRVLDWELCEPHVLRPFEQIASTGIPFSQIRSRVRSMISYMLRPLALTVLRASLYFLLVGLCSAATPSADSQTVIPSAACMPDLSSLSYPPEALKARIVGTVNVTFSVDSDGKIDSLELNSHPLLRAGVEQALRAAQLGPECKGKRMTMRINFRILDDATTSSTVKMSAAEYDVIAPRPIIHVVISEPATVGITDLYKQADLVAVVRVISGDSEHYEKTVYKAEVQTAFKGTKNGEVLYFTPFIGYGIGSEYVAFLLRSNDKLVPKPLPGLSYGSLYTSYQIMYEGFSIMPLDYACVFDGKELKTGAIMASRLIHLR